MVFAAILLLVLAGIVAAVLGARSARTRPIDVAAVARRVYLYGIALVAVGMLVTGLAGLLEATLEAVVEAAGVTPTSIGQGELRGRVSFSGALTAIGLIAWLVHWGLANRPIRRGDDDERRSGVRKFFLYAVLFVGGIILTVAGRRLVTDLLRLGFGRLSWSDVVVGDVLDPFALLVVAGAFWLYYERVARLDRQSVPEQDEAATLRRWCVYGLCFFGLFLLLFGATGLIEALWETFADPTERAHLGGDWLPTAVADRVGSSVAGLALWYLGWRWSWAWFLRSDVPDPEQRSVLRKVYLYLVLAIVVAWSVWNLGQILYQLLRSVLIPEQALLGRGTVLRELGSSLGNVLVFGLAWLYHAHVVRREAALAGERGQQAAIRRIYGYLVALVGAVTFAVGAAGTAATLLDLLVQPGAVRPTHWWEDRISLFVTLVVVGLPIWLASWLRLEREAADPLARQSLARRIYLFLAFGLAVLTLLGGGAFTLYQLIRFALGERWTAAQTSELLAAASSAAVAALLLAYHLRVFRRDAAAAERAPRATPSVALLVARSSDPALLAAFQREIAARVPAGVELELLDLDPARAEQLLGRAKPRDE